MAKGIDRRKLIKTAGVGAALVWSAPMLQSVAYAQDGGGSGPPTRCATFCDSEPQAVCGGNPSCFCFNGPNGQVCIIGLEQGSCSPDGTCPPGQACVEASACTGTDLCFAVCPD